MNLGQIVARVQKQFGDTSGVQITRDDIVGWANDAQLDIARKTEALQGIAEYNAVLGQSGYVIPSDFYSARRVTFDGARLEPTTLEEVDTLDNTRDASNPAGTPSYYYLWGGKIYLFPAPGAAGVSNLDLHYLRLPATLTLDGDIPEVPPTMHEAIVRFCLARAKESDEDDAKAAEVMGDYETRVADTRHDNLQQQSDSYPSVRLLAGDY